MTNSNRHTMAEAKMLNTKTAKYNTQKLLTTLTNYIKSAGIDDAPDSGFEQAFASVAYSYVKEKASALMDYLIGFQLVERNDDSTKAVGIFGFNVNGQWAYIPVFFLNGNLKGSELLYLKNQDRFVTTGDSSINELLNKKPQILGKDTDIDKRTIGKSEPSFRELHSPPSSGFKYSSYVKPWARDVYPKIANWILNNPFKNYKNDLTLDKVINQDVRLAKIAIDIKNKYPVIATAMDEYYGPDLIKTALLQLKEAAVNNTKSTILTAKQAAAINIPAVEIDTTVTITENKKPLSDSDREKILREGYLIKDHRKGEEFSVAYNTQIDMSLLNPSSTDIYEVLVKPGNFKKCLYIHRPYVSSGRSEEGVLVDLSSDSGSKAYQSSRAYKIFVKPQEETTSDIETYKKWYTGLSDNKNLEVNARYVIVDKNGVGTGVFEVDEDLGDGAWKIYWNTYGSYGRNGSTSIGLHGLSPRATFDSDTLEGGCVKIIYFNTRKGTSFKLLGEKLYLPEDVKVIKLKDPPVCRKCSCSKSECKCDYFSPECSSTKDEVLLPANLSDLQLEVLQKTAELKIYSDGNEVVINNARMSKLAGLFSLVKEHGLSEKQAKIMIKKADTGRARFRIKYAASYPMGPDIPDAEYGAPMPYSDATTMYGPQETFADVPGMSANETDPSVYESMPAPDPQYMNVAQQAAQSGQREVFDTAMVSSMLKAVSDESLIDKFIAPLSAAVDKLGRILFMFYWHNDQFKDRFGKQDMPEFEDTLKNGFNVLNDIVAYLKQKTVNSGSVLNFGSEL